ncbi:lysogeny maintenance protein PflM [Pseudomonas citronellolis]|uniref:lysogeny maintenance protein PflM n=1 Tax=Pseudomonas citronellolis TaxID=53408 RepID=UPI003D33B3A5
MHARKYLGLPHAEDCDCSVCWVKRMGPNPARVHGPFCRRHRIYLQGGVWRIVRGPCYCGGRSRSDWSVSRTEGFDSRAFYAGDIFRRP